MTVIQVENLYKQYRLGQVGSGTLRDDFSRWWNGVLGKEDPLQKIGEINDRTSVATSDYVLSLRDINFSVQEGEVLGIIGKNGAGKSTLLKVLSKVTAPSSGQIKINGRVASLLEVGTGFHPELTGKENIYLNNHFNRNLSFASTDALYELVPYRARINVAIVPNNKTFLKF